MKTMIVVFALLALAAAADSEPEPSKQKRGLFEYEHGPAVVHAAPVLAAKSYETPIIHTPPIITKVFEAPPAPFITKPVIAPAPIISKAIVPAPIIAKPFIAAPLIAKAPIYTAPIITKPIIAPAPIFTKSIIAAPAYPAYAHGW
ncbi:uncharacterized protein LOC143191474 isoform X3 [Rhynchophorus ferrugineus]|uniref:uncharacterized protein LOC143191474 isoform X3 n=1 Tax=Rhynchophorus ferrugineus TaxID=354439 RepID=UPI003FCCA36A